MSASPDNSFILDAIKSGWTLIVAPVLGWIGWKVASLSRAKQSRKMVVRDLLGLPDECKQILASFHDEQKHTLRSDPYSPSMCVLVDRGIMSRGARGGTYDIIDKYMSISPHVWEVMDDWRAAEEKAHRLKTSQSK